MHSIAKAHTIFNALTGFSCVAADAFVRLPTGNYQAVGVQAGILISAASTSRLRRDGCQRRPYLVGSFPFLG